MTPPVADRVTTAPLRRDQRRIHRAAGTAGGLRFGAAAAPQPDAGPFVKRAARSSRRLAGLGGVACRRSGRRRPAAVGGANSRWQPGRGGTGTQDRPAGGRGPRCRDGPATWRWPKVTSKPQCNWPVRLPACSRRWPTAGGNVSSAGTPALIRRTAQAGLPAMTMVLAGIWAGLALAGLEAQWLRFVTTAHLFPAPTVRARTR